MAVVTQNQVNVSAHNQPQLPFSGIFQGKNDFLCDYNKCNCDEFTVRSNAKNAYKCMHTSCHYWLLWMWICTISVNSVTTSALFLV